MMKKKGPFRWARLTQSINQSEHTRDGHIGAVSTCFRKPIFFPNYSPEPVLPTKWTVLPYCVSNLVASKRLRKLSFMWGGHAHWWGFTEVETGSNFVSYQWTLVYVNTFISPITRQWVCKTHLVLYPREHWKKYGEAYTHTLAINPVPFCEQTG